MNILFLHPNFPAQFMNLASVMGRNPRHRVVFITAREQDEIPGVQKVLFKAPRAVHPNTHPYIHSVESAVLQGQSVYRSAAELKRTGFVPDVIVGHSGWGSTLYMKDLFPQSALVGYFEWFYHAHGTDLDFDPAAPLTEANKLRVRTINAPFLFDLCACDAGISPTRWQQQQFPPEYHHKISVLHDGIDTERYCPKPGVGLVLPEQGIDLPAGTEIITYVGRGMEPYRGFPQFMEAMSLLMARRPGLHVVVVGADRVAYGGEKAPDGKSFKEHMLETFSYDLSRIHFTGLLPRYLYLQVLQASAVHAYLTRPFVLSWSLLEAMAAGCMIVASDTAPVREVIHDGINGLLVDFFSPQQMVLKIEAALEDRQQAAVMRQRARETIVEGYDIRRLLPQTLQFLEETAAQVRRRSVV
ncbi:MAG TPA: glycosyltransferase family 4 protein [Patescibacteria group bacterium]|nr:glycosyltransferase family 4 protein [Patescibacteria group bacterium]